MRFSSILFFATAALAAPATLEPRQQKATVASTILSAVTSLEQATNVNIAEINKAVATIQSNVQASIVVTLQATIKANFAAIAQALREATGVIINVTSGAAGGIIVQASNLTQEQINQLIQAISVTGRVLTNIRVVITLTVTNLGPDVAALFSGEINAVLGAIGPFLQPLIIFLTAVRNFSASLTVTVQGLSSGLNTLVSLLQNVVSSIGLQGFAVPGVQALTGVLSGSDA